MTVELIIAILLAGILSHNYALTDFLGTGAVIENHRSKRRSLIIGLGTTLVMVLATLITFPLNELLVEAEVEFLQPLVFVVVVLVVVELVHLLSKNHLEDYCKVDFLKFAINGAVLGLCIHNTEVKHNLAVLSGADFTLLSSLVASFAVGLGLTLTMIVFSSLLAKIDEDSVPESFRGLPIALLIAGMMALVVLAF